MSIIISIALSWVSQIRNAASLISGPGLDGHVNQFKKIIVHAHVVYITCSMITQQRYFLKTHDICNKVLNISIIMKLLFEFCL